jgi:hypothetical protein
VKEADDHVTLSTIQGCCGGSNVLETRKADGASMGHQGVTIESLVGWWQDHDS